jgi:hypothetical protein
MSDAHTSASGRARETAAAIGAAAQLDDDRWLLHAVDQLQHGRDQHASALSRDEHTGTGRQPLPGQLDPAEHVLQRLTGHPPGRHRLELRGRDRRRPQLRCLLLGKHAPGIAEPVHQCVRHDR